VFMKELLPDYEVDDYFGVMEKETLGLDVALIKVCETFDVNLKDLISSNKGRRITDARSVLAVLARMTDEWTQVDVAVLLRKSHGTISRLASRGEQRCDLVGIARSILKPKKQN